MPNSNLDYHLQHASEQLSRASSKDKPEIRLLLTFIRELAKEEKLDQKTQLLLFRIAPNLVGDARDSEQLFLRPSHPARRIVTSIVRISRFFDSGNGSNEYLYKSLKESISTLKSRKIEHSACLNRVAADLEYIAKLARTRSKPVYSKRANSQQVQNRSGHESLLAGVSAGPIAQAKIRAAFIIMTEATKFDVDDSTLLFALTNWLELLTVTFIKFPSDNRVEKQLVRMTFLMLYLCDLGAQQSASVVVKRRRRALLQALLAKLAKLSKMLGDRCLGRKIDFSGFSQSLVGMIRELGESTSNAYSKLA